MSLTYIICLHTSFILLVVSQYSFTVQGQRSSSDRYRRRYGKATQKAEKVMHSMIGQYNSSDDSDAEETLAEVMAGVRV